MDVLVLRDLENAITKDIPTFKVGFKDESTWMRVLGFLAYPFNPDFMTVYTTTWGTTVYFPSRAYYEGNVLQNFDVLTHEYVHMWDKKQTRLFTVSYAFPQALALVAFVVFGILAGPFAWLLLLPLVGYVLAALVAKKSLVGFWGMLGSALVATASLCLAFTGWVSLALLAAFVCFVPWPAPWRTQWELRGYTMSIAVMIWLGGTYSAASREFYVEQFVGSSYFFMSWSRSKVIEALDEAAALTTTGALQGSSPPYSAIYDFLYQHGLLRH